MAVAYLKTNPSLPKGGEARQIILASEAWVDGLDKLVPTLGNMIDGGIQASGDNTKFAAVAAELGTGEAGPNYPIAKAVFDKFNEQYIAAGIGAENGIYATIKNAANLLR